VTDCAPCGQVQLFAETEQAAVRWRLLSGNNRELGRSLGSYPDAEACRLVIKELQAGASHTLPAIRRVGSHAWSWQLMRGQEVVAEASHSYDRRIRCEQAMLHFAAQLGDAVIRSEIMLTHSRRWHR
jgi:hypothetical protein